MRNPVPLALLLALALLLQSQRAAAQSSGDKQQAKEHFSIGVELLDESPPNYQRAYTQFSNAYELSGSWKVLGNMGLCAHRLERDGEAAEFYRRYLINGGKEISAEERRDIQRDLLAIKASLAVVKLRADIEQGSVIVKRTGSQVAAQVYSFDGGKARLGLRAGAYRISLQSEDKEQSWLVVLKPKQTAQHKYQLIHNGPAANSSVQAAMSGGAEDDDRSAWGTAGYVTGGLGIVALGVGAYFGRQVDTEQKAADARLASDPSLCIGDVCREAAQAEFGSARSAATTANALFIGGGILAAAGAAMVIWSETSPGEQVASVRVVPTLHPHQLGLQVGGSF